MRLSAEFRILWAHLLLNNYNGAKILADKFITRYPNEPMTAYAYLAKGLSLYRMGDYDRALEVYQEFLNKFPESSAVGKAVYLMTLCLHSARDPFRMAGILNEVHGRMSKATEAKVQLQTQTRASASGRSRSRRRWPRRATLGAGERNAQRIRAAALGAMAPHGVSAEYLALVDPDSFLPVDSVNGRVLVAVAARVGDTRLIDNALWWRPPRGGVNPEEGARCPPRPAATTPFRPGLASR